MRFLTQPISHLFRKKPDKDPTSFGNLAISNGYVTEEQLQQLLTCRRGESMLGQLLVQAGYLTETQRDALLLQQLKERGARETEITRFKVESESERHHKETKELLRQLKEEVADWSKNRG